MGEGRIPLDVLIDASVAELVHAFFVRGETGEVVLGSGALVGVEFANDGCGGRVVRWVEFVGKDGARGAVRAFAAKTAMRSEAVRYMV